MTDRIKEQLSAFLDGELPEAETTLLLKRLERDEDLKGTLSRYSLIGAVMRSDGDMPAAHHVAARVRAAIADEPSFGARPSSRWLRPAAGLAVAASVALATVLLLPRFMAGEEGGAPAGTLVAAVPSPAEAPLAAGAPTVVVASDEEPAATYTTPPVTADPSVALPSAQLASYLVAHSEYTLPLTRRSVVATVPPPAATADAQRKDAQRKQEGEEAR